MPAFAVRFGGYTVIHSVPNGYEIRSSPDQTIFAHVNEPDLPKAYPLFVVDPVNPPNMEKFHGSRSTGGIPQLIREALTAGESQASIEATMKEIGFIPYSAELSAQVFPILADLEAQASAASTPA